MVARVSRLRTKTRNTSSKAIIELRDVEKTYRLGEVEVRALRGISLSVQPGEFVSIVGKSGSGKSTLVNMIGCLDTPTHGHVYLEGRDIAGFPESELARVRGRTIGFIFQTFNLMPTLSVYENVALPMVFADATQAQMQRQVNRLLELVGLADRRDHKPSELSGGQRQRTAIARALANDPRVVLADEPTGNLDSKTGRQVIDVLLNLNRDEGATIILVTHDDELAALAPRTVVLADGQVSDQITRTAAEVKRNMKAFFTEDT